jgi:5-hmdU DNA kinase, helical domain/DNA polymerase family A
VDLSGFTAIVAVDFEFEFGGRDGNLPRPVCMVAKELRSGKIWRLWRDEFGSEPPFPIGANTLFVSFTASAELGCFKVLGWPMPARILDLSAEYRNFRNLDYPRGIPKELREKKGLIDACRFFDIDMTRAGEKKAIRRRILEGEPFSEEEREAFLDYCAGDVIPLEKLLAAMAPHIDLRRALLRGRHEAAIAAMEYTGVPIDVPMLTAFREHWTGIQDDLIVKLDANFGVYEGRSFRRERFAELIARLGIRNWPQLESGQLDLEDKTFRDMAKAYPVLAPLRELRHSLSSLRLDALAVGEDGRNRTKLWPYSTKTGRNLPAPDEFIFGPSRWLRGLIKPGPGFGVAYIDWKTQEVGIAAALSGDENMMADYLSEDLYIAFGIAAGVLPKDATKETHKAIREMLKQCVLGVLYGMGAKTLALKIGRSELVARSLIEAHRRRYKKFWQWSNAIVSRGMQRLPLSTVFGWRLHPTEYSRPTTLMNFPMQANGAEILRLACCLGTERGIRVCAPIHDAILIEAPLEQLEADVAAMREAMAEASRDVLHGFELVTECPKGGDFPQIIRYPQRYMDERGSEMWNTVMELVTERQATPRVRGRTKAVDDLLYWIEERERVRMRKEAGAPEPYTDDEILRTGRFCNVRREDDRTTRWIAEHWRTPHANDPDLFLVMTIARLVNKAETLDALGYPLPWDPEHFLSVMAKCDTPYGAAYTITAKKGHPSKPAFQAAEIFGPLWEARAFVRPRPGDTLERFSTRLSDFKYLGSFYRGQIIADLKYVEPLRSAPDWTTFAEPGPGSKPGLNLVLGRPADAPWTDAEWRGELRGLRDEIAPDLERLGLGDLHMQDLQNCCCEIFKFLRAQSGERSVRRKYRKAA